MSERLTLIAPDDWHVHLRDGEMLQRVVAHTARSFRRAIAMPNLKPPVTTTAAAAAYRDRIHAACPEGVDFVPLMTAYLTDSTDPSDLEQGFRSGVFTAAKLYPANATTNSAAGVTDLLRIETVLACMQRIGMPLLIHGELTSPEVDVFDREAGFIEQHLKPLLKRYPDLRVVFEHITTEEAVDIVTSTESNLAATITPHHLHINRNAMFAGGLRSDFYCRGGQENGIARSPSRCHQRDPALGTDSAPLRESRRSPAAAPGSSCSQCSRAMPGFDRGALDQLEASPVVMDLPLPITRKQTADHPRASRSTDSRTGWWCPSMLEKSFPGNCPHAPDQVQLRGLRYVSPHESLRRQGG